MYNWSLFYFCRLVFKNVLLRVGITIIINSRINDPVQCWCRRLFCDIIFIIFFDNHPIPQLGEYTMNIKFCIFWQFPWNFVISVYQGVDGRIKCRQKYRIGSLLIVFAWQVCTVLFRESGWRLIFGTVIATRIILFNMPPLLILWSYIMLCQQIIKLK